MRIATKERAYRDRNYSAASRCARILARHRNAIAVRKDDLATANLTRIIDATLRLSNKKGFHSTTVRDLAKASGLSMGGVYSYVASKEALVSMILGEVLATVDEVLAAPPPEAAADPRAHLRWIIDAHIRLSEAMQPWFVFCFMEAKTFPARERQRTVDAEAMTEGLIGEIIARGVAAGAFAIGEVGLSAALIKPLLQDWYVKRAKYRKRGTTIEDYIAAVTAFAERALTAAPMDAETRRRA
ncbi:MAG TPA: helix-turn-helix domain-containing protein [Roseiarcus sp.]|nr:helix-turn-helix domain-containing protein [Roseiarcus sp.]